MFVVAISLCCSQATSEQGVLQLMLPFLYLAVASVNSSYIVLTKQDTVTSFLCLLSHFLQKPSLRVCTTSATF
jgi:hypothetical protein